MDPRHAERTYTAGRAACQPVRHQSGGVGMIKPTTAPPRRYRWLSWQLGSRVRDPEPNTTATASSSVGFEGAKRACIPIIEGDEGPLRRPNQLAIDRAVTVLNARGARLMRLDRVLTIGLWGDAVGPDDQSALRVLEMDTPPVRVLGGAEIPTRYKLRRVQEFQNRLSWPEWKAEMLNALFKAQGIVGESGRI